eukprot:m.27288 g.27288  ORF g.27288 m.27288 type:complete len:1346 (-) comp7881_c0_seq2:208-4245(-)
MALFKISILIHSVALTALASTKSLPYSPFAYIQSSFVCGHESLGGVLNDTQRREALMVYANAGSRKTSFHGGEMFINTLETPESLLNIRAMNQAILDVAKATKTPPYYGLWIPARLPGTWWPENYTAQPKAYRACGLRSDGKPWYMYPTPTTVGTSILNVQGSDMDITNDEAVNDSLTRLGSVMRANCTPLSDCVGPLVGTYLFSEAALAAPYLGPRLPPYDIRTGADAQYGNISDLQPPGQNNQPPLLKMGNVTQLYSDDNVTFSFYQGPKRTVPLFTESARDSFVAFAAKHNVSLPGNCLPADREEFNADSATIILPEHVCFVPTSNVKVWGAWEEWVYTTWFTYCSKLVATMDKAQEGNEYYQSGALYFQLAGWYSIRAASHNPLTYNWRSFDDPSTVQTTTDEIMHSWPHYLDLNPVSKGIDLEMFAEASWFNGFIHEASHGVPVIGVHVPPTIDPQNREERDRYFLGSDRHRHFVNAQGTLAKNIMKREKKLFGVFSRAAFISDPTFHGPSVADTLTPLGFAQAWNYTTALLQPDIVSSLNNARFIPDLPDGPAVPPLYSVFESLFSQLELPVGDNDGSDVNVLAKRVLSTFLPTSLNARDTEISVESYVQTCSKNGSWSDIVYHPPQSEDTRSIWPPLEHVTRLTNMSACYAASEISACYKNKTLLDTMLSALEFWFRANLTNQDNWYQPRISVPNGIGQTCLTLQLTSPNVLNRTLSAACVDAMLKADWSTLPPGMTNISGANMVWMATAHVYAGLFTNNDTAVHEATDRIFAQLYITKNHTAGFKQDGAFFQHDHGQTHGGVLVGPYGQLYNGGYGNGFLEYLTQWAVRTNATMFAMSPPLFALFARLLEADNMMIVGSRDPHWDVSVIGREISRPHHRVSVAPDLLMALTSIEGMTAKGKYFAEKLSQRLNGRPTILTNSNRMFWKADYMIHSSSIGFTVTMRMFSTRTLNTECIAEENTKGKHMGAGSVYLYYTGNDFEDSYPMWDWQHIPGTTIVLDGNTECREVKGTNKTFPPNADSCWVDCANTYASGETSVVGGASNGEEGVMMFQFVTPHQWDNRLSFARSVHFIPRGYVSILTNVSRVPSPHVNKSAPIISTLDQRPFHGALIRVFLKDNRTQDLKLGQSATFSSESVIAIWADNTTYMILPDSQQTKCGSKVTISAEERIGNWLSIGIENATVQGNFFMVYFQHCELDSRSAPLFYACFPSTPMDIIPSSLLHGTRVYAGDVHALLAETPTTRVLTAAFFRAAVFNSTDFGIQVETSNACSLIIQLSPQDVSLSVSDPTQTLTHLQVVLTGSVHKTLDVELPQSEDAGSTVLISFNRTKTPYPRIDNV